MAIFGFKKRKDEKLEQGASAAKSATKTAKKVNSSVKPVEVKESVDRAVTVPQVKTSDTSLASIIIRPRITEKSGILSQNGVYTFEVTKNANKATVAKAFAALYKVRPVKVAVMNTSEKRVFVRGKRGVVSGIRKAVVTVKKGEKIEFV